MSRRRTVRNWTTCHNVACDRRYLDRAFTPELVCPACKEPLIYPVPVKRAPTFAEVQMKHSEAEALLADAASAFSQLARMATLLGRSDVWEEARPIADALEDLERDCKMLRRVLGEEKVA